MLSLLLVIIAIALGSATSVMVADSIRKPEPTTDAAPSNSDAAATLTSPAGAQVQVVQSRAQIMLGMLSFFVQADPLQAIKALPESIVLWDPFAASWMALRPTMMSVRQATFAVTIDCASGHRHRIIIHDEMHGTVFQDAAAVSDWNALVAASNAPDSRTDNAMASQHHFCAACVPIELKPILMNGNLDRAIARFDNVTQNSSCEAITSASQRL